MGVIVDWNGPIPESVQDMCNDLKDDAAQVGMLFDIRSF